MMDMEISNLKVAEKCTFLDYIFGGCQLQVSFAVGFAHKF